MEDRASDQPREPGEIVKVSISDLSASKKRRIFRPVFIDRVFGFLKERKSGNAKSERESVRQAFIDKMFDFLNEGGFTIHSEHTYGPFVSELLNSLVVLRNGTKTFRVCFTLEQITKNNKLFQKKVSVNTNDIVDLPKLHSGVSRYGFINQERQYSIADNPPPNFRYREEASDLFFKNSKFAPEEIVQDFLTDEEAISFMKDIIQAGVDSDATKREFPTDPVAEVGPSKVLKDIYWNKDHPLPRPFSSSAV